MKILLTYFLPFGEIKTNSSEEVAKHIKGIDKLGLDVSYTRDFPKVVEAVEKNNYDFIIMLGQAKGRKSISIEERAKNFNNIAIKDNDGNLADSQIEKDGPEYVYTGYFIDDLCNENVYKSSDAGSYLCNYIYYKVLFNITKNAIFIHLPLFHGQTDDGKISITVLVEEIERIIRKVQNES